MFSYTLIKIGLQLGRMATPVINATSRHTATVGFLLKIRFIVASVLMYIIVSIAWSLAVDCKAMTYLAHSIDSLTAVDNLMKVIAQF